MDLRGNMHPEYINKAYSAIIKRQIIKNRKRTYKNPNNMYSPIPIDQLSFLLSPFFSFSWPMEFPGQARDQIQAATSTKPCKCGNAGSLTHCAGDPTGVLALPRCCGSPCATVGAPPYILIYSLQGLWSPPCQMLFQPSKPLPFSPFTDFFFPHHSKVCSSSSKVFFSSFCSMVFPQVFPTSSFKSFLHPTQILFLSSHSPLCLASR